jgi:CubicO group peptidase (beta-lactamase class C family)
VKPAQWRSLIRKGRRADEPGLAFARLEAGRTVFEDHWGLASLELPARLDRHSVFNTGSLAKQFVAACIHHLEIQGRLSLDDRLRAHLPELPKVYEPVRLRHLLWHTSGVLCYTTLLWWSGWFERAGMGRPKALDLLKRQSRLNFKPGSRYLYGNSNYLLLAELIERRAGGTLGDLAQRLLFKPLGMPQTHFKVQRTPIPGLVAGHWGEAKAWRVNQHPGATAGPGRLMSSLADLERWVAAWTSPPRALKPVFARMRTRGRLDGGAPIRYGSGLMWQEYRGLPIIRHDGYTAGCRSEICHVPDLDASLIALLNRTDISPTWTIRRALDKAWPRRLSPATAWPASGPDRPRKKRLSAPQWRRRLGVYREEGLARAFELKAGEKGPVYESYKTRFAMCPDACGGLQGTASGAIARLDFDPDGRVRLMQKGKASWYRRLRERPPSLKKDAALLGDWRCPSTGARISYILRGKKLYMQDEAWTGPVRAMDDGSYYFDQIRIDMAGRRQTHACEDAWILKLDWVKA